MTVDFTLRQLTYFLAAARLGTTSAAAEELYMSQSTMSSSIADLERSLDTQLFVRSRGIGLKLTDAGAELLPHAERLLADARAFESSANDLKEDLAGDLTVCCFEVIAPEVLPRLLREFGVAHPRIRTDFIEGSHHEILEALRLGRAEMAFLLDGMGPVDMVRTPLVVMTAHVLLHPDHHLANAPSVRLKQLEKEPMVYVDADPSQELLRRSFRLAGAVPFVRYHPRTMAHVRALVRQGLGYTLVVQSPIVEHGWARDGVVAVPVADPLPTNAIYLAHLKGTVLSRRAAAFWNFTVAAMRPH